MPGWPPALRRSSLVVSALGLSPGPGPQSVSLIKRSLSTSLQPSVPQVPNYRLSMTIPDWLQAVQNYMKTLQYPSNQGLSRPSQGMGVVITSLVACLSPAGQQVLSKVREGGHGGMFLRESLEGAIVEDVTVMIDPSPFRRDGKRAVGQRGATLSPEPSISSSFSTSFFWSSFPPLFLYYLSLSSPLVFRSFSFSSLFAFIPTAHNLHEAHLPLAPQPTQTGGLAPFCTNE